MRKGFVIHTYKSIPITTIETEEGSIEFQASKGMFGITRKTIRQVMDAIDQGFLD